MWMYFVGWIFGIFFASAFIIQPLIVVFFSFPYSWKLKGLGYLAEQAPIVSRGMITIILNAVIVYFSWWGISLLNHNLMVGCYVGAAFALLLGIGRIFKNRDNIADFIENHIRFIHPEFLKIYVTNLLHTEQPSKWLDTHLNKLRIKSGLDI